MGVPMGRRDVRDDARGVFTAARTRFLRPTHRAERLEPRRLFADLGFDAAPVILSPAFPTGVASDDFNGDGHAALAVAHQGVNAIGLMLGRGDGTFGFETRFSAPGPTFAITSGDF